MNISTVVNKYARQYSPYASGFVNHLPMGQLALYMMGNPIEKIESYSEDYANRGRLDPVLEKFQMANSIDECVGNREMYEACLSLVKEEIRSKGVENFIEQVLNQYPLGISSGLFHTTIRLAYAVEGMDMDKDLEEEVARALAYYITAYREGKVFTNQVKAEEFKDAVEKLFNDKEVLEIVDSGLSRGKTIHELYNNQKYMELGPIIEGTTREKVEKLLELLLTLMDKTDSIVVLHCITGLQALLVLEEYFKDFSHVMDIMTTYIITHLLTVDNKAQPVELEPGKTWDMIIQESSNSPNVHTIKFAYTTSKLFKTYKLDGLRNSAGIRAIRN